MTSSEFSVEGTASVKDEMGGQRYRHKKRGSEYDVLGVGKMQAEHWMSSRGDKASVDYEEVTVYRSREDGQIWVRPREEFEDGRFELLAAAPSRDQVTMGALPDDIRAQGWAVAVHNDYRQHGEPHTFWLFTKGDRAVKGEGRTDADALNEVRRSLVPTAEQGVPQLGGAPDDLRNLIKVVFAGLSMEQMAKVCAEVLARRDPSLSTPPIAGAGEELIEQWRDGRATDVLAWCEKAVSRLADLAASEAEWRDACNENAGAWKYEKTRAEAAEARIGELERDKAAWDEAAGSVGAKLIEKLRAAEAKLAEALEPLAMQEVATYAILKLKDEGDLDVLPAVAIAQRIVKAIRARSFHSPKEPGPAGGVE